MLKEAIGKLTAGQNLSQEETSAAMREIMTGGAPEAQIAAFITALRMKGETINEITACADVLREKCIRLVPESDTLEIVGTGGDCANTFNISTTSSIVAAAAGVPVTKHGNRSVSSKSGAADVLEALGVKIDLSAEKNAQLLKETGICFLFAQKYHASMRFAGPVRKAIGIRTVFNIIGPLANPAFAKVQLLGVYNKSLVKPLAEVLINLGITRGMVVYGDDGLDELTVSSTNTVAEIDHGQINEFVLDPAAYGFKRCRKSDLLGGGPEANAKITREILSGRERGAKRDAVLLNAGVGIYLAGKAASIAEGIKMAAAVIENGQAAAKLEAFVKCSNKLAVEQKAV